MKRFVFGLACLGLAMARAQAQSIAAGDIAAEASKCQACHDAPGQNAVPRLNGQHPAYILTRLREFHNPASQTPHATYAMWDMSSSIGPKRPKRWLNSSRARLRRPRIAAGHWRRRGNNYMNPAPETAQPVRHVMARKARARVRFRGWRGSTTSTSVSNWKVSD